MRMQFILRSLLPHFLLALVVLGLCQFPKSVGAAAALAVVVTFAQLFCWYGTDLLVTGRVQGERMIRESKEYIGSDGRPTSDPELAAWLLLATVFYFLDWAVLSAPPVASVPAVGIFLGIDVAVLFVALSWSDAYGAFTRHVRPRLERERQEGERRRQEQDTEARRQREVQAARREAEQYYASHRHLLADAFPEALFCSSLNAAIPDSSDPADAWSASSALIKAMQPLLTSAREVLRQEQERARKREARRSRLQEEIAACEQQIRRVRASALDADVIEDEVEGLNERLRQLHEQIAALDSPNGEGDE